MATVDTPTTIAGLFFRRVTQQPQQAALYVPQRGEFRTITWQQLHHDVLTHAAALRRLGLQPGERVVQLAENRYEWIVADLAILLARGVHVPVHTSLSGPQVAHQILDSEATVVLLAGQAQADALASLAEKLRPRARFVVYDIWSAAARHALQPTALEQLATQVTADERQQIAATADAEIRPEDLATIMYTSGTQGEPKGVMLSHQNLTSNAIATADSYGERPDELRLCFLPLSHIYARTCDVYTWLYRGSQLALAQSRETIIDDCQRVQPTFINGVPYFYDKLYRRLRETGKLDEPGIVQKLLGGKVRACFSGGAPVPLHVFDFFAQQGLPILEGYGLSEASPVISVSTLENHQRGCVGRPIAGTEVRIADDGEILTRGPNVMLGYWKNEAATQAVLTDGWLHTGDLGMIDEGGYLRITGRKKEILVTAAGKKVAPTYLEQLMLQSPFILQAIVVGEGRNYLTALIVPDPQALRAEIRARRLWVFSRKGALRHRHVQQLYRDEIDRLLAGVSRHEQIGRFTLLDRGFTIESGELTPKASLRREAITKNFAATIDAMYR